MTELLIRLFVKDSEQVSNPDVRGRYGKLSGLVGVGTNLLLFVVKFLTGFFFHSIAIMADAVNNFSDMASSLITLIGFKLSSKPADAQHPYGHARMEYISGLIVSFLVMMVGVQLVQSSFGKILRPQPTGFGFVVVAILAVSILLKLWQSAFYAKIGKKIDSTALQASSQDSRNDVLSTAAVLLGALVSRYTGLMLDGWMGLAVAVFIIVSGIRLIIDTTSPLLGLAPTKELVREIYRKIMSYQGILGLHDLNVHNYGPGRCFASVHCEVPADEDIMVSHDIIDNIERDFLKDMNIHLVIHLDPIVTGDERTNELKEAVAGIIREISPDISMHDFRVVWGTTHSNLIFDVVVPYRFRMTDDQLQQTLVDRIHQMNPNYHAVVVVDHTYVPQI
ncbi:Cation-efflux pump [Ruminococcaceae bacterium BL-6]|nr:Cation-efflux pump [Ruminococcaceae bacterium BL-6]